MQFSLDSFQVATCTHVNKRTENHGDTLVHVKDLNWRIDAPNTLLDKIHPGLRHALYKHAGSKPIPGVEDTTPELRTGLFEGPFNVKFDGTGYILTARFGEVSGEQIELGGSELAKMKVDPKDGGSMSLFFRSSHKGLTMEQMGRLDTFDGKELTILLAPPALQTGTPGKKDKKAEAAKDTKTKSLEFEADAPAKDATEVFTDTHAKKPAAKKVAAKKPASFKAKAKVATKKVAAKKANGKPKADTKSWPSDITYGSADKRPAQVEPKVSKAARKRMRAGE